MQTLRNYQTFPHQVLTVLTSYLCGVSDVFQQQPMYGLHSLQSDLADLQLEEAPMGDLENRETSCDLLGAGDMDQLSIEIEKERWVISDYLPCNTGFHFVVAVDQLSIEIEK